MAGDRVNRVQGLRSSGASGKHADRRKRHASVADAMHAADAAMYAVKPKRVERRSTRKVA